MRNYLLSLLTLACLSSFSLTYAADQQALSFEQMIHHRIYSYAFSTDNLLKLAAYCEMKGEYDLTYDAMHMQFGGLGKIIFYPHHCVLRNYQGGIFHLDQGKPHPSGVEGINHALAALFEKIPLMGNYGAEEEKIQFVDSHIADKNFEPFDKLYLRHLLLKYGQWNETHAWVELRSQWLPEALRKGTEEMTPLLIRLYPSILRGYYVKIGGTVYVEQRHVDGRYATGESSKPNVTAFKSFLQKLFQQSIHFIKGTESQRLNRDIAFPSKAIEVEGTQPVFAHILRPKKKVSASKPKILRTAYDPNGWMVMVIQLLRSNHASIADPEILPYFKDQACFPQLYHLMNNEEREKVDRQMAK